ncbi:UDP-N-acetylmuramate dehydrogenase [Marinomonas sp. IMCC 4694]|uniref:UDP-N-acetylmuramate dehydrogenase n=1 Tax=Marinomonas sp. IMCC 4694 TaxID=2605432 RepID=UPI0021CC7E3A|nr:UDP-N-acetylmuramate dehydrogenase [Marinomonas sp. IMCC 4694]
MNENALNNRQLGIEQDASLLEFNTLRFDYKAEYLAVVSSLAHLKALLQWANDANQTVTMIGGGSNLLICADVSGLVIINRLSGIQVDVQDEANVMMTVAAGENWHHVVEYAVSHHWYGIENLALIPGTMGAAPVQNIGAYGVEIKDVLRRVQVIHKHTGEQSWIDGKDCGFAYRDSHFKGKWKDTLFITAVELSLKINAELLLSYGGLVAPLDDQSTLLSVFERVCEVRRQKLPDPSFLANAGSFFKNPLISKAHSQTLKARFPELVSFALEENVKLAAGWLIDQAGWKGKRHLGVGVYDKQALVLVNYSEHKADALLALEALIKQSVYERYGVLLEREPVQLPLSSHSESLS